MKLSYQIIPYTLKFKQPAGTSRGVYRKHNVWYVVLIDNDNSTNWGIGECAPLPDLSCDFCTDYADKIDFFCQHLVLTNQLNYDELREYPSILFGLETAWIHLQKQTSFQLYPTSFSNGKTGIPINGLIWMGDILFMQEQIDQKLKEGYRCIKLKIGSLDFEKELDLLKQIRKQYSPELITLRVDANGAFNINEAPAKLEQLSLLNIHSIEQPIKANQWPEMAKLTQSSSIPIALDEELIGHHHLSDKQRLLEAIRPQFIVLKPSLHGGISGTLEWIKLAETMDIGWWITSALESNIGLNSIAQWCATLNNPLPQGLGTGSLYTNNIDIPLYIKDDCLWFDNKLPCPAKVSDIFMEN